MNSNSSKILVGASMALAIALTVSFTSSFGEQTYVHSETELNTFRSLAEDLPETFNGLFATSGKCVNCHGSDPDGIASTTGEGEDVNVVDAWRSSMMANSAKDPFWKAKIRQEALTNPGHAEELENVCTKCHAPLGRHAMEFTGVESYTFAHLQTDTAGLDGVSCVACHQQTDENPGNEHSGDLHFAQEQIAYGPFESPLISPMALESGYTPEESAHISDAGICASCHSLVTSTVDLEGDFTGDTFIEQATYHEWLNSTYAEGEGETTCQDCHMPDLGPKQPIQLAAGYDTPGRAPFSKHTFAGANTLMLQLMQDNLDTLDIAASEADYQATIEATYTMLQQESLILDAMELDRTADTLSIGVELTNLAGHKFPSGYPARRLFVHVKVIDEVTDEVVFESGEWDENYYLVDEAATGVEEHYDVIRDESEVQIYEMVMGDVNGDVTTVLERADIHLKDNRLTPAGFSVTHEVYDTTMIVGNAVLDDDFNQMGGVEGSGSDEIEYRVPMGENENQLSVGVDVWYQSIPPKWTEELFAWDDPLIEHFQEMYESADRSPVLIKEESFSVPAFVGVAENQLISEIYVNGNGSISGVSNGSGQIDVYTIGGKQVASYSVQNENFEIALQVSHGVYLIVFETLGETHVKKLYIP
ncbi:MAG: multiheme c-type cytochrome [Flavobacteriales bacterium]|nr:multiheme c-type cytochrome [Flavobacteriales bacterium]